MTCCRSTADKRGFATLAAAVLCLALGMMASILVEAASLDLRAARSDLERVQAQYRLDGAQRLAAQRLLEQNPGGRVVFNLGPAMGNIEVVAEPEFPKLSASQADQLDQPLLKQLNVADSERLRGQLSSLAETPDATYMSTLDASPLWQACGPSLISAFGLADHMTPPQKLSAPAYRFSWRAGEVWRLRLADSDGWTDERWVRFTGDRRQPAATILRSFRSASQVGPQCDPYLG